MYARGILFGKMKYELGDHSFVQCPEQNLVADIEFKTKGYFGGTYNAIGGTIKNEKTGDVLFELSGMWSGEMTIKNLMTGKKELLFDATHAKETPPVARPLEEQGERESQRLWQKTILAIKERNHEAATDDKTRIEDIQRDEAAQRANEGAEWHPRLFRRVRGGPGSPEEGEEDLDWILDANIDAPTPDAKSQQILAVAPILKGQKSSHEFDVAHKDHQQAQAPQAQTPQSQIHQSRTSQSQIPQTPPPQIGAPPSGLASNNGNLIEFGEDAPPARQPVAKQQQVQNQAIPSPYVQAGLQEPLQPQLGAPIVRLDSTTHQIDEFVDANDGT
ncbi:hypothetical protein MMC06_000093 [Schaereria dolodes]|nr:hypothetical protein [Schaereria dolodes]